MTDRIVPAPDLNLISPDCGDQYSHNLHRFLNRRTNRSWAKDALVYRERGGDSLLFIGYEFDGDFIGRQLVHVLTKHTAEVGCYGARLIVDVVPDFWSRYLKVGVCAIDTAHRWYGERWSLRADDTRECEWCGLVQREEAYTVVKHRWVPVDASVRGAA